MASGNDIKNKMSQTTSRQKVIGVAMAIVVLIIIWQVFGLMKSSSSPSPAVIEPTKTATSNGANDVAKNPAPSGADAAGAPTVTPLRPTVTPANLPSDPIFDKMQKMVEEKYVSKLNELEELRIQQKIAETNQAIAAAKLATVTAEKDISDLLTGPSPLSTMAPGGMNPISGRMPPPVAPTSGPETSETTTTVETTTSPPLLVAQKVQEIPYTVISVSMILNKWNAVMSVAGQQGIMYNVSIGDILPLDGSKIVSISKSGVILRKDGKSRTISILTSI
jgi:hypothetical protein